jgi:transcriptional regulator
MRNSTLFTPDDSEVYALIAAHPLAQFVSSAGLDILATPLPLLLEQQADGSSTLLGHFARANPQWEALEIAPEALAIFMGPHGYISPSWFTDRTQAPTWNFATVHVKARVAIDRSAAAARDAVDRLTEHMEKGRLRAWSGRDMNERYERLLPHVVAFRAQVLDIQAKFKLGQNERLDVLEEALDGFGRERSLTLHSAMRSANSRRLTADSVLVPS